jgi:hypothetical protein
MNKTSIYGWVVVEFYSQDDTLVIRRFKVKSPTMANWKFYLNNPDVLDTELDEFENQFSPAFKYVFEGDLLSLNCRDLEEQHWNQAVEFWREFFQDLLFEVGDVETLEDEDGVRPHLTPDDQIRADNFEDFLDSIR